MGLGISFWNRNTALVEGRCLLLFIPPEYSTAIKKRKRKKKIIAFAKINIALNKIYKTTHRLNI